jgi:PAS domain S-box-containing protein
MASTGDPASADQQTESVHDRNFWLGLGTLMRYSDTTHNTRWWPAWKPILRSTDIGRYGVAVGLVAAAFLGRWLLRPVLGASSPYLTSYLAVMAAAIWCGVGPALAATFLSTLIGDLFFLNPFGNPASAELIHLGVMLVCNVGIAILGGIARSSRQRAEQEAGSARRADEALRESEERFRALVEAVSQMVWTADEQGATYEDSPSWRAFTGRSLQEWLGWGWADAVHPEDRDRTVAVGPQSRVRDCRRQRRRSVSVGRCGGDVAQGVGRRAHLGSRLVLRQGGRRS